MLFVRARTRPMARASYRYSDRVKGKVTDYRVRVRFRVRARLLITVFE